MATRTDLAATTPTEIRESLFEESVRLTDAQLLVLVLGMGTTRHGKGYVKKTWTAIGLAEELLTAAGGRLEHLVAYARRADFDHRRFGLGQVLGSRIVAAMELAHRWRRGFRRGGDTGVRASKDDDLAHRILQRRVRLTEGELVAVLLSRYWIRQNEVEAALAAFSSLETMIERLTPVVYLARRDAGAWPFADSPFDLEPTCRVLGAIELARRHRARAGFERHTLKPGSFGLKSSYLLKLLDPESPLDRPTRQKLLANVRSHPRMVEDFARLDRLASDAGIVDYPQAIQLHWMFKALLENREWSHPAEVLGEPIPFGALLLIAEAKIDRAAERPARTLRVRELLEAAELAAIREPVIAFAATLAGFGISESGLERAFEEARHRYSRSINASRRG